MDELPRPRTGYQTQSGRPVPRYFIVFVGALVALGALSMDAYLPAIPTMAQSLGVHIVAVNNTISIYLAGVGIGQFLGGSLSDQLGRKTIGLSGLSVFCAASLAIGFASSIEQVQLLRFVQALGGGFSTVIGMATVRDVFPERELGRRFATVTLIMLTAPLVAPALGSWLLIYGWPFIFFAKAGYGLALLLALAFLIPETREGAWSKLSIGSLPRQVTEVVTRKVDGKRLPLRYVLALSFSACTLMTFLTNASFMYLEHFGLSPQVFPIVFSASVVGLIGTNLISMRKLRPENAGRFFRYGLQVQLLGVTLFAAAVVTGVASLFVVVPLMTIVISTLGFIGPSGSSRFMGFFSQLAGTAASVQTTSMFFGGAFFGAMTGLLFNDTLLPMAGTMFLLSLVANLIALSIPRLDGATKQESPAA